MTTAQNTSRSSSRSILSACAVMLTLGALMLGTGCDKLKARDNLNKGVQAYKNARFETAIDYFKKAVQLDARQDHRLLRSTNKRKRFF